ncbi:hypothetical protein CBOM_07618 [Ceraceosorus bombacis]|uniref:Uncharacterized protein n=1 Tax=Ceraceosorus bombacis TaxID=401625 RepID=A0A0P1BHB0_9BASI|nr:hypothetical protein CBOM_07618 [Ceraceosorus bombacis]
MSGPHVTSAMSSCPLSMSQQVAGSATRGQAEVKHRSVKNGRLVHQVVRQAADQRHQQAFNNRFPDATGTTSVLDCGAARWRNMTEEVAPIVQATRAAR